MGYSVDYKPTRRRAKRTVPKNKAQRTKDIKNAIRWNIRQLEHDKIAPTADPSGDHVMQQLISDGILGKPERRGSVQMFDRTELLTSLKAWVGVL